MARLRALWSTLWFKLTAAFLLVAIIGVAVVSVLANRGAEMGFNRYLLDQSVASLPADLAAYYSAQGSWETLDSSYRRSVRDGLRVARKQAPPSLLKLPISAPEGV